MITAFFTVISSSLTTLGFLKRLSIKRRIIPPIINTIAIGIGSPKTASILSSNNFPNTKAGITAHTSLM